MLDSAATSFAIIGEIGQLAHKARPGDLVLITYSVHRGQTWDVDGEEDDSQDGTWVAFDRQIVDDELYQMWRQFAAGVRVVVCSDSCHSGSVVREVFTRDARADIRASVLLAGCQDSQLSYDGPVNGQFTGSLLEVWGNGAFTAGYSQFHRQIMNIMPPDQVPNLFTINAGADLLDQRPFTP